MSRTHWAPGTGHCRVARYSAQMSYLQRLIDYNSWANRGMLEFLAALPEETLDLRAAGVYGSIRETLDHLLSSEISYHRRLLGGSAPSGPRPEKPDIAFLLGQARESAAALAGIAERLPAAETLLPLSDGNRSAATMLTQLLLHGCEHRAHVGTILGANGIEPPDIDAWAHGILAGNDDWPAEWGAEPADRGVLHWGKG